MAELFYMADNNSSHTGVVEAERLSKESRCIGDVGEKRQGIRRVLVIVTQRHNVF
jgi:hypothetical protein